MPSPAPFSSPQNNLAFPALYLYPLNDSFIPKHISLNPPGQRVKIGRQTNAKTSPGERNGYFDSKVLSRQHAEVWEENNKIFIKDVKSSNGTFINGERLSAEGAESDPFELKTDDIVEFGIDIVGEDNKTIIHHKVAARVSCIFTEQQARTDQQQNQGQYSQSPMLAQPGPPGSSAFNFAPGGPQGGPRRPQMPPHQVMNGMGMGGMGGGMRQPGKSGLTFDHILSRLQGELTKSRETGQDLQTLSGAMNDIQDTLGGSLPPDLPPYPHVLPPVRPPQVEAPSGPAAPPAPENTAALSDLQSQLLTTQSSLATHVDKIRALEGVFAEQEAIKQEVRTLRDLVGALRQGSTSGHQREPKGGFDDLEEEESEPDDDDDARSVSTVVPHSLERVDEEDEEEDTFRSSSPEQEDIFQEARGRPGSAARRAWPAANALSRPTWAWLAILARSSTLRSPLGPSSSSETPSSPPNSARLTLLSTQLESALAMSETLQAQHAAAQTTIGALEDKVKRLEGLVSAVVDSAPTESNNHAAAAPPPEPESVSAALLSLKSSLQGQWSTVQEEWAQERERLKRARDDWESQMRGVVDERIKAKFSAHDRFAPSSSGVSYANGGLATPPSPRSLSADSTHARRRRRRSGSRGRSGSPRGADVPGSPVSDDAITELASNGKARGGVLATPDSSVHASSISSFDGRALGPGFASSSSSAGSPTAEKSESALNGNRAALTGNGKNANANANENATMHIQTAIGVLVLSVAAAAVIWRVKPE
ncbi:hypothetical protein B0H16DRAFT_1781436 [Mycena metata]|uniref:FHA domain-containing protein n=1 Tax=Mycena metata TaxID=1033252 RepID=A0AAD7MNS7_9AGAR|nr:hypothetical protein B0H16DRAFT_1781436 [Mycena metata]